MTRRTNARLAGFAFLFYIAVGLTSLALFSRATGGAEGTAAALANLARQATTVRVTVLLTLLASGCAAVLGVTLHALTSDEDRDIALLALCCRLGEGVVGAVSAVSTLQLLAVAMASTTAAAPDAAAVTALGGLLLHDGGGSASIAAACFAVGSLLFCWLFLRARSIPVPLAWLGVIASVVVVLGVPAQLLGLLGGTIAMMIMWLPMLVFEVTFALWLIIKGVAAPSQ